MNIFSGPVYKNRFVVLICTCALALFPTIVRAQKIASTPELLPTGQAITPTASPNSRFQTLKPGIAGFPNHEVGYAVSTAISPNGKTLLVLTSGYTQVNDAKGAKDKNASMEFIFVFDNSSGWPKQIQALPIVHAFGGIVWNPNGDEFYVGGGVDDVVHTFGKKENAWAEMGEAIPLGHKVGLGMEVKPMAAGVGITADGKWLIVANYENDSVTVVDLAARKVSAEFDLRPGKSDAAKVGMAGGEFPYSVAVRGNDRAYVSSVRDREIVVVNLAGAPNVVARIALHGQPNKMTLNRAQTRLYVAEDNSDTLAVIDTSSNQVLGELIVTAPHSIVAKLGGFKGSNPNSVSLAPDERTAYVTLGGANAVAVVRLTATASPSEVAGLIPTGWYPNAVSVNRAGTMLYIVNGKSVTGPNPKNCRASTSTKEATMTTARATIHTFCN